MRAEHNLECQLDTQGSTSEQLSGTRHQQLADGGDLMLTGYVQESMAKHCLRAGAPLDFGKGRWLDLDRGIVSATPAVHKALLQAIKEIEAQPQ